jgi:hypothetical protein
LVCPAVLAKLQRSDEPAIRWSTHAQEKMIAVMHWKTWRIK